MTIHPSRFDHTLNASKIKDAPPTTPAPAGPDSSPLKALSPADFRAQLKSALEDSADNQTPAPSNNPRPLTPLDLIPRIRGPIKPLTPISPDDRPGVPPVGPMVPLD